MLFCSDDEEAATAAFGILISVTLFSGSCSSDATSTVDIFLFLSGVQGCGVPDVILMQESPKKQSNYFCNYEDGINKL